MSKPKTMSRNENAQTTRIPKLRFPEFRDSKGWAKTELKVIADPVLDRASSGEKNNALSLSTEQGIVLQSEIFEGNEVNKYSERYLKIIRDDFIYSDRSTKISTSGTIKRLFKYSAGVVSPVYKCFRFHAEESPGFWEGYFESGAHNTQLSSLINEGARVGRFNISINKLLSINVWRPCESEQKKIADCLKSLEKLIAAQSQKVRMLNTHKIGLTLQLFPRKGELKPRLRFPEFRNAGEWEDNLFINTIKITSGKEFKPSEHSKKGIRLIQAKNIGYGTIKWSDDSLHLPTTYADKHPELLLRANDIVFTLYRPMRNDEIKITKISKNDETSILSQRLAKLEIITNSLCVDFALHFCRHFLTDYAQSNSIGLGQTRISLKELYKQSITLPSLSEQLRIAGCLDSLDSLIISHTQKLESIKKHKAALMQNLFPSLNEADA
jgi:type I restriction enzyme S subunit